MNRIAELRAKRTRYIIRDDRGRFLWRHWRSGWEWTTNKHDARVFRNRGSAERRADEHAGARVVPLTD